MQSREFKNGNKKVILSKGDVNKCYMDFYENDFCWMRISIWEDSFALSDRALDHRKYSLLAERYLLEGIENMTFREISKFLESSMSGLRRARVEARADYFYSNEIEYTKASIGNVRYIFYHGNFKLYLRGYEDYTYKSICSLSHDELMEKTDIWELEHNCFNEYGLVKFNDYDTSFYIYQEALGRVYSRFEKNRRFFIETKHLFNFKEEDRKYMYKAKLSGVRPIVVHVKENGDLMWDCIDD